MTIWLYIITIWANGATDDIGGRGVSTSVAQSFFYDGGECQEAKRKQEAGYLKKGLKNFSIECHRRTGPLVEPEAKMPAEGGK